MGGKEVFKQAIIKLNQVGHDIYNRLMADEMKIFSEINSIKLVSSPQLDKLLTEYRFCIEKSGQSSREYVNYFATDEFASSLEVPKHLIEQCHVHGPNLSDIQEKIIKKMKSELDEM